MAKKRITRREFMQVGLTCLAGTAAPFGPLQSGQTHPEFPGVSRTSLKQLHAIPTTCGQCEAGCGIVAYLDGERLVQLLGNPNHPNNGGGICGKGIAGVNLVNDPERLLFPMKRGGKRGEGQWSRISWDEVYALLRFRVKNLIENNRADQLVIDMGSPDLWLNKLAAAMGTKNIISRFDLKNSNRLAAFRSIFATSALIEDVGRSRTILNFGANPYAQHDHFIGIARRLVDARINKGAKLFTFDVRMSETAAKSDEWFPIKAGTDGIIALAVANFLVERGLVDKAFINSRSSISLEKIKDHLSQYTLAKAQMASGISAENIKRIAEEFGTRKPSLAMLGGGVSEHENGSQNATCIFLLNFLVGNLEREGGLYFPRYFDNEQITGSILGRDRIRLDSVKGTHDLAKKNIKIDTYFACKANPAHNEPDCLHTIRFLKNETKIPLLVVMDTHLTETAELADIVLPAATYLEGWGISNAPSLDRSPLLNLRRPVVSRQSAAQVLRSPSFEAGKLLEPSFAPKGEAQEIGNFCLELARRIGGQVLKQLPFKDTQEYTRGVLSRLSVGHKRLPQIIKEKGFYRGKDNNKNDSPNKTLNLLPDYIPIVSHAKKKEAQFILTPFKTSLWSEGTKNSKWVREIFHSNRLWINKDAAGRLGIKNGDKVRVSSSLGSLMTKVLTTSRIHPDSVAMATGIGHRAVGKIAQARRFKSDDHDTNLLWWNKEGCGINPNEIIENRIDPTGGGQCWKDTVVRIEKL